MTATVPSIAAQRPAVGAGERREHPVIRIEDLCKRFAIPRGWRGLIPPRRPREYVTALDGVSLTVAEGEILALLGPNGAGKTTLLKTISTLVLPDRGTVEVDGVDVVRDPAAARRLLSPVAADERSLEWRLSARENLRFFGALQGLHGDALRRRIDELLDVTGLADAGEKRVGMFSSGMRQRLLIARGLLPRPRVLLLDEPTRSLDPLGARAFRDFLGHEVAGQQGCTILMSTHDPDEALGLSNRIAILDHGRVVALGTQRELADAYVEDRFRVWMHSADLGLAAALVRDRYHMRPIPELDGDEHSVVDIDVRAGRCDATELLAALVRGGVRVARFEKVQPTVADLMERVVRTRGGDARA